MSNKWQNRDSNPGGMNLESNLLVVIFSRAMEWELRIPLLISHVSLIWSLILFVSLFPYLKNIKNKNVPTPLDACGNKKR